MTLTDFLLARIAEDEATAINWVRFEVRGGIPGNYVIKERVLAECEAKRRQIKHLIDYMEGEYAPWNETQLQIMATVYADHPDYQPEWRP